MTKISAIFYFQLSAKNLIFIEHTYMYLNTYVSMNTKNNEKIIYIWGACLARCRPSVRNRFVSLSGRHPSVGDRFVGNVGQLTEHLVSLLLRQRYVLAWREDVKKQGIRYFCFRKYSDVNLLNWYICIFMIF